MINFPFPSPPLFHSILLNLQYTGISQELVVYSSYNIKCTRRDEYNHCTMIGNIIRNIRRSIPSNLVTTNKSLTSHLCQTPSFSSLKVTPSRLQRGLLKASFNVPTRVQDTDLMGHINNVNYYAFMDTAICSWSMEKAANLKEEPRFIAETGLTYHSPCLYPETIVVEFGTEYIGNSSVKYQVGMFSKVDDRCLCTGHFIHVYVKEDGRPTPISIPTRNILESIQI